MTFDSCTVHVTYPTHIMMLKQLCSIITWTNLLDMIDEFVYDLSRSMIFEIRVVDVSYLYLIHIMMLVCNADCGVKLRRTNSLDMIDDFDNGFDCSICICGTTWCIQNHDDVDSSRCMIFDTCIAHVT